MQAGPELSIVMINYNAKELTAQAVDSIFAVSPQLSFEIVLLKMEIVQRSSFQAGLA